MRDDGSKFTILRNSNSSHSGPSFLARLSGVSPNLSTLFIELLAPCSNNPEMTCKSPVATAMASGVVPMLFASFTFNPIPVSLATVFTSLRSVYTWIKLSPTAFLHVLNVSQDD